MRIGIITFHRAHNYGAVLQCYALQEYLVGQGFDVKIIDYKNNYLLSCYKVWSIRRFICKNPFSILKKTIKELTLLRHRANRSERFNKFILSSFNLEEYSERETLSMDLVIIGSDQVWNTHLTNGFDSVYWGEIRVKKGTPIISYAASIEELWNRSDDSIAKNLLSRFDAISVRENSTAIFLRNFLDREIIEVIDPTLLVDSFVWYSIAPKPQITEKYLLLFQVRCSDSVFEFATRKAKELRLKLICLSARIEDVNSKECIDASPMEFVGWFRYASYIICTSFHGTVFSLIFNVNFISIKLGDGRDGRVESILKKVDLQDRFVELPFTSKDELINWNAVNDRLNNLRKESQHYLSKYAK